MLVACTVVTVAAVIRLLVAEARDRFGAVIVAALVLSLVGDVFLVGRSKAAFRAGLGSFLLGHVAFGVAFVLRGVDARVTALALGGLAVVALVVGRWLWPHVEPKMRASVVAYITVITVMVALAAGTVAARGHAIL